MLTVGSKVRITKGCQAKKLAKGVTCRIQAIEPMGVEYRYSVKVVLKTLNGFGSGKAFSLFAHHQNRLSDQIVRLNDGNPSHVIEIQLVSVHVPCEHLVTSELIRRPANALNVEIGSPLPRCKLKPPQNWETTRNPPSVGRWLASGGSPLVLGQCNSACPLKSEIPQVVRFIEAGSVAQAEHPDFRGCVTVGTYQTADGTKKWAVIHHGGTCDTGGEYESSIQAARAFVFQVGRKRALASVTPKAA